MDQHLFFICLFFFEGGGVLICKLMEYALKIVISKSINHTFYILLAALLSLVWPHTFVSPSADSRRAVVSYWRKYVHEVLVNRLGGLSLPRKSVVRLTDRPDMTLDVYRGRKTTTQQQQHSARRRDTHSDIKCFSQVHVWA